LGSFQKAIGPPPAEEIGWRGRQTFRNARHPTGACKVYHEVGALVKLLRFLSLHSSVGCDTI
jgi:hypothetical protein